MCVRYLSSEWISAADNAVKSAAVEPPAQTVVITQHVHGAASYQVVVGPSPSVTEIDPADTTADADATFTQDLATATAVAQGSTDAHQAFLLGHIRFEGDIHLLIERGDAFDWLANALAPLLQATDF